MDIFFSNGLTKINSTKIISRTNTNVYAKIPEISKNWKKPNNLNPTPLLLPKSSTTRTIFHIKDKPDLAEDKRYGNSCGNITLKKNFFPEIL